MTTRVMTGAFGKAFAESVRTPSDKKEARVYTQGEIDAAYALVASQFEMLVTTMQQATGLVQAYNIETPFDGLQITAMKDKEGKAHAFVIANKELGNRSIFNLAHARMEEINGVDHIVIQSKTASLNGETCRKGPQLRIPVGSDAPLADATVEYCGPFGNIVGAMDATVMRDHPKVSPLPEWLACFHMSSVETFRRVMQSQVVNMFFSHGGLGSPTKHVWEDFKKEAATARDKFYELREFRVEGMRRYIPRKGPGNTWTGPFLKIAV